MVVLEELFHVIELYALSSFVSLFGSCALLARLLLHLGSFIVNRSGHHAWGLRSIWPFQVGLDPQVLKVLRSEHRKLGIVSRAAVIDRGGEAHRCDRCDRLDAIVCLHARASSLDPGFSQNRAIHYAILDSAIGPFEELLNAGGVLYRSKLAASCHITRLAVLFGLPDHRQVL